MADKIKVLVVDDSSLVRKIISDILEKDDDITVIGTANNGKTAIYKNDELNPDVITLDIEMPILDGLATLKHIMGNNPKPVIMMSVLTQHGADATFKALDLGAFDFVPKPSTVLSMTVEDIGDLLISKVKSAAKSKIVSQSALNIETRISQIRKKEIVNRTDRLVAIGTSTGGPSALINVFKGFPKNFPAPVLVVQHMPEGFTTAFAKRLNDNSNLEVKEADDGDEVLPGHGYLAPGHSHMEITGKNGGFRVRVFQAEKVSGHMPSIDVLFNSMAKNVGNRTIGVIMTGMGRDGATGLMNIKKSGGFTMAQNEETSVVYGMNRVAVQEGATDEILPLGDISSRIIDKI